MWFYRAQRESAGEPQLGNNANSQPLRCHLRVRLSDIEKWRSVAANGRIQGKYVHNLSDGFCQDNLAKIR